MHIWAQNIHYFMSRTICTMDICILNTLKTFKSLNIHNFPNLTPFWALCSYKSIQSVKMTIFKPRPYCRSLYWPICLFSIGYQQKIVLIILWFRKEKLNWKIEILTILSARETKSRKSRKSRETDQKRVYWAEILNLS